MKIAIGTDHAGVELKKQLFDFLSDKGYTLNDCGTNTTESVDYPDYAHKVAKEVEEKRSDIGLLICGSGNGIAMAANKHQEIRAAIAWTPEISALAKQHNNANVLVLPGRFIDLEEAKEIVLTFLSSEFEGGRHARRVQKIPC